MIANAIRYYLRAYKGLSREIWLLALVNLINRCGTMVIPFLMLYLTSQLGCSISQAGVVMSLWGIGAFIGSYFGGRLTDNIGFYKIQLLSLFFGGIGFIILGQLGNYYAICIFTFLLAMVNEAFRPANSAAMGKFSTEENRMRSFTLMRLSFNLGWAVGAGLGGFIAHHSYQLLFWIDGITNILAAIMLWYLLPDKYTREIKEMVKDSTQKVSVFADKVFVQFILVSVIYLSCFVQLFTNLPVFFKKDLHLEENLIGYLASWNGILIVLIEMTVIYWVERNWSKRRAIILGVSFHVAAYLFASFFHLNFLGAFMMMTMITLSEMFAFSVLVNFWMSRTDDTNRGQYAAIWTMVWAFSQTVGPFLGSVTAQHTGFKVLWLGIAILSTIATFLYAKIIRN
ncbi:MAG: MFS transporter [Sphingobacteriales bacterium]|nr:MFS transporter [Sphingobacteriales bacterium]